MAELMVRDGTWVFDGDVVRIVPGRERGVHRLRQDLGEVSVPLAALAGIAYEPARKGGRLRLRLRDGADPLLYVTGGGLPADANPYQVAVDPGRSGVAEYFADEVRQALAIGQVPDGPADRYLLPGPAVPLLATGVDGTATFDGDRVHIDWRWYTSEAKKQAGARDFTLAELEGVEWRAAVGLESGFLRFRPKGVAPHPEPEHDPNSIELWGFKKESGTTALLAAAVAARLPHPSGKAGTGTDAGTDAVAGSRPAPVLSKATDADDDSSGSGGGTGGGEDHDALLRRLRELGELHRDGILTAEEFASAKSAVLKRFHTP
ncbi:DUF4429 domain-containing protein [Streptomyces sp. MST-110588]|uniref:DUF4429 domain-containing protein n=1 Tax=Streptomyces sp. MST-110588 TaxID=2833628 RepID=UPI001F5DF666|nr:DUF4429 domain-containing protein [Streptomyces sp. MST-110588]UNO42382.1 DUF4429 domain-containing protein [Streptomyces sp. MST-110588]